MQKIILYIGLYSFSMSPIVTELSGIDDDADSVATRTNPKRKLVMIHACQLIKKLLSKWQKVTLDVEGPFPMPLLTKPTE